MQVRKRVKQLFLTVGLSVMLLSTQNISANTMEYQEVSASVMMNALQPLAKTHFLRKLYTELFFVPVWMQEEQTSSLAKELFAHISADKSLSESSQLKRDALRLSQRAKEIYSAQGGLKYKIEL